ncbi:MAG: hypothetical protein AB1696_19350 [Planctomycetota bacterium]
MSEDKVTEVVDVDGMDEENAGTEDGVIRALADLPPETIISEAALGKVLNRSKGTLKRAVQRNELPPPIRLLGEPRWTVGAIVAHIGKRLAEAQADRERFLRRISERSP